MAFLKNAMGMLNGLVNNNVINIADSGAPVNGTSGTGVGICGPGSTYVRTGTGGKYVNTGTAASPTWVLSGPGTLMTGDVTVSAAGVSAIGSQKILTGMIYPTLIQQAGGTIVTGDITGTSAGQLGHAAGYPLIAAQGTHNNLVLIEVTTFYAFSVAAYTGGGNVTINRSGGGAALTGLVSYANSYGAAANKITTFRPLAAAAEVGLENDGFNLVSASAPTQPGTAAGVIRWVATYRYHATGF